MERGDGQTPDLQFTPQAPCDHKALDPVLGVTHKEGGMVKGEFCLHGCACSLRKDIGHAGLSPQLDPICDASDGIKRAFKQTDEALAHLKVLSAPRACSILSYGKYL